MTFKRLVHIPLSWGIKEIKLFSFGYVFYCHQLHAGGVKKAIRIAAVIDALQAFRKKLDVHMLTDLHR